MPHDFLSRLTGSFAMKAAENPTVAMVEAACRHHGLDIRYINCEVPQDKLRDADKGASAMGWIEFNCSIPHKVEVIEHLDGLGESAAVMRAVNCAVLRDGNSSAGTRMAKAFCKPCANLSILWARPSCGSARAARQGRSAWNWPSHTPGALSW